MGLTLVITLLLIWGIKETKTANNSARNSLSLCRHARGVVAPGACYMRGCLH